MRPQLKITIVFFTMLFTSHIINAQHNAYIEYYDNGETKAVGFKTINGVAYGEWTYFRKDGSKDAELMFNEEGVPQGPFLMYYKNGQLQTKGNYSGKGLYEMEGSYEDYHSNGQLKSTGTYTENKLIGKWKSYFNNGKVKSITEYTDEGIIQKNTEYFSNGQLRLNAQYNEKGYFIGELIIYYDNGQMLTEQHFDDSGNNIGTYKSYYKDGTVKQIGNYSGLDNLKKTGEWKTYYNNGQLKLVLKYDKNGKRIGDIIKYDKKGNLIQPEK